jgi:hypothetical protein
MTKKVLIVGAGPSAALAVLAASDCGAEYTVMSNVLPQQRPPGAFFLHWVPPSLHALPVEVELKPMGNAAVYAFKQWGCGYGSSFPTSWRTEEWYPAELLGQVWTSTAVLRSRVSVSDLLAASKDFDWVFHTFPLRENAAQPMPVFVEYTSTPTRPVILYNGTKGDKWCRRTMAFGEVHTEYPVGYDGADRGSSSWQWVLDLPPWTKPVTDRLAPNVVPLGRIAKQDPKYLAHQAYEEVAKCLNG